MNDWRDSLGGSSQVLQTGQDKSGLAWTGGLPSHSFTRDEHHNWGPDHPSLGLASGSSMYGRSTPLGDQNLDTNAMSNEQLFSAIVRMDVPPAPSSALPSGMQHRQPSISIEEARAALKIAKASTSSKAGSKCSQNPGESGSDEEDGSPEGSVGKSKRVQANRQSAHRSRLRKLQYIQDLENNVNRLQAEIGQIQPQLAFLRDKYTGLSDQNRKLRDRVASLLNEAHFKECLNTSLRQEISQLNAIQAAAGSGPEQPSAGVHPTDGQGSMQPSLQS